jgi:uncharacterized HAD superfamily protein
MSKKLKIGVDIDDVLFPFNRGFINLVNKRFGTDYKVETWSSPILEDETKFSKREIEDLLDEFSFSEEAKLVDPIFGSVESIQKIKNSDYELHAITARPLYIENETRKWLERHFQAHFKNIHHLGRSHPGEEKQVKKGPLSKELEIDIFIEDSLRNSIDIAQYNIHVILLDKPWNQEENLPGNIHRVKDWNEILEKIEELKNVI